MKNNLLTPGQKRHLKIKFGAIVAEARGKISGNVFARNGSGAYVRNKTSPINPSSTAQIAVRVNFTNVTKAWRGLTQAQRDSWNQAATTWSNTNIFGDSNTYSGQQLYMKLNQQLAEAGQTVIVNPPTPGSIVGMLTLALTAASGTPAISATFTPAIPAAQVVIVYATPPYSPGKKFVKKMFRKIAVLTSAATSPDDLLAAWEAVFGTNLPVGSKISVKFMPVVKASGITGTPLEAYTTIAA